MARYFFHVMDGKLDIDERGLELPDMDRVRSEAVRASGQMLSNGLYVGKGEPWRMIVADEAGTIVFGVNFSVDHYGL